MKNLSMESLLEEDNVVKVLNSIRDGEAEYRQHVIDDDLPTENGKYHEIWNYIFKYIKYSFNIYPYRTCIISRGPLWSFIVIYDEINKTLYVLMKEERLKDIKNTKGNDNHYIKTLNYTNNKYADQSYEQLSFLNEDNNKKKYIEDDLRGMLEKINGKVELCVNIIFSEKKGKVVSMSGNVYDYNLNLITTECWNKYIKADIDDINDISVDNDENPLINLPIKNPFINNESTQKEEEELAKDKENSKKYTSDR